MTFPFAEKHFSTIQIEVHNGNALLKIYVINNIYGSSI